MNELALFAGAGGGLLGSRLLGWRTVCAVEFAEYPRRVLLARQRDGMLYRFPIWDDVRTFDGTAWRGKVDIVTGGFPCQSFSNATRGRNTATNYWPEMLRIIGQVQPSFVFSENVSESAIFSSQEDLAKCGYKTNRCMLSAKQLGADHIRKRYWLFAYADNESKLGCGVDAKVAELQSFKTSIWESDPRNSRVADGMAGRMDRFTAIGNGQVPAVVRLAWNILAHNMKEGE
jgi:DNA (cytosine-5)-methyltransferase 1